MAVPKKKSQKKKKKNFSAIKMDGDHGLAETFFEIRPRTSRKIEGLGSFFFIIYNTGWLRYEPAVLQALRAKFKNSR